MTAGKARRSAGTAVLGVLALTQFLMTIDASVMNVSISALVDDLDTTVTAIQGVITAYTLVMAATMITGGKLGDLMGRRRALRIGCVIYAAGSGLTALAPNVEVLLLGWSILEGLGAALIMPTVVALIGSNFTGRARANAYATIAAAAAVAIGLGPIIGGFVTAEWSWRWVFAAEVPIALGILFASRVIRDAPVEERSKLDLVGAVLSAAGIGLLVYGVLQSSAWGWVRPKIPDGADETPQLLGLSAVIWLVIGGLLLIGAFLWWQQRLKERGGSPLVDPSLFSNRQLTGGLTVLALQYLITMGMFFAMPLFLSIVLGLDAFETGVRMLPLSLALVVTAPAVPKLFPHLGPRQVARAGLLAMLVASLLLAGLLDQGAGAEITLVPFILMGIGIGALASQLGNVIASSVGEKQRGEAGGLQYTAQNLGSSLGTALVGAVVIGALGSLLLQGVQNAPQLDATLKQSASTELSSGVPFVSDAQLKTALAGTDLSPAEQEAIVDANADARLGALRIGMIVIALFVLLTLFLARALPTEPLIPEDEPASEELLAAPARAP